MIKKLLHTTVGARVGMGLGLSGFNQVTVEHIKAGETSGQKSTVYNARTDKGAAALASLMTGASQSGITSPLPPLYLALSTTTLTPAKTDTTLTGETSVAGLARVLGTVGSYTAPTTLDGVASYSITYSFVLTGSGPVTVNSVGLFDAISGGNLQYESNVGAPPVMNTGDTFALTWTINL